MSSAPLQSKRPCPSSPECVVCYEAYDLNIRVPIIGTCGHTMCSSCRSQYRMLFWRCPICQKMNAFREEVKNFLVIQMIEQKLNEQKLNEEKLKEQKRQKTSTDVCSLCQTPIDDTDARVCLGCVQKKGCKTLTVLIAEVDALSFKMCSRCLEATQKHDGHETLQVYDAKAGLYSMCFMVNMEHFAKSFLPRLDQLQNACEILNETYRDFYNACMTDGQIGDNSDYKALAKIICGKELEALDDTLASNVSYIWKLTNEVLEKTEAVKEEKQKRRGRKFTAAEDSAFREVITPLSDEDPSDEPEKLVISIEDWKKLTLEEKKAQALELIEESSDDEESEDEESKENEEGAQ